jgi:hypothetical protein
MSALVTIMYYAMTAYIAVLLAWNFVKRRKWQDEFLYLIILIPFLLRVFRLK